MSDRDCENCKHHTEKGCDSWDCNFEQGMTRGKAIEVLKDLWRYEHSEFSEKDIREALDIAIKALEQEPKTGRWIPVTERLPEDNKTVIASVEYGVYPEAKYTKEYGWEWAYEAGADYWVKLEKVKAWMPLPKPYNPQESEG